MADETESQYWEGTAGDDLAIPFQLIDENGTPAKIGAGDGVTDIVAEFTNGSGTETQVKLSDTDIVLVDATCGRGKINVSATVSATLRNNRIKRQTFSVFILKNGKKTTWVFDQGLFLKPRPVPAA
jgi:hypothetical protein